MGADVELDRKIFAAVDRLGRALRAVHQQAATENGLSLLGLSVIEMLADGRARHIGALAAELSVSQPTVSDAVTTLQQRGLLERRRDPRDLRSTLVALTDSGTASASDLAARMSPLLAGDAGNASDRATTLRVLISEIARLQAAGVITVDRSCLTCRHYQPPAARSRARCLLLDKALRDQDLRVDCDEHESA